MLVKDILSPSNVLIENQRFDKASLLRELCNRAAPVVELPPQTLFAEVMRREELGSTGLGQGIAIPHTRLSDLKKPYSFMIRLRHPIDFDAVDGEPVDIVFFLLLPVTPPTAHLNNLACVARSLRDPTIQSELRKATDSASLYRAVTEPPAIQTGGPSNRGAE
jgi:nitrogen PTS system EIIA component